MSGLSVEVNVETLLEALRGNRTKHEKEYAKAKKGWQKLLHKELTNKLLALENGGELILHISNQKPTCHLDEYDEAIGMLEISASPTIRLDQGQYRQYVNDNWSWRRDWAVSNSTYIQAG